MASAAPARLRRRAWNPVLIKELRSRFRGARAFVILTAFLIVLSGASLLIVGRLGDTARYSYYGYGGGAEIGRYLFGTVTTIEFVAIAFLAPALTMNAISGERERQSLELLLATPLSASKILRGKMGAALAYVLLLLFSALPVMSLAFLLGGVSPGALAMQQATLLSMAVFFLSIGLYVSSRTGRTGRSAVITFGAVAALCLFLPILFFFGFSGIFYWLFDVFRDPEALMQVMVWMPAAPIIVTVLDAMNAGMADGLAHYQAQAIAFWLWSGAFLLHLASRRLRPGAGEGGNLRPMYVLGYVLWIFWIALAYPTLGF